MTQAKPILWIVIPCYNEEKVLPITAPRTGTGIRGSSGTGVRGGVIASVW